MAASLSRLAERIRVVFVFGLAPNPARKTDARNCGKPAQGYLEFGKISLKYLPELRYVREPLNMGLRRGFAKNGQILQRGEFCAREYWLGRCVANVCKDAHSRDFRREVLADSFF